MRPELVRVFETPHAAVALCPVQRNGVHVGYARAVVPYSDVVTSGFFKKLGKKLKGGMKAVKGVAKKLAKSKALKAAWHTASLVAPQPVGGAMMAVTAAYQVSSRIAKAAKSGSKAAKAAVVAVKHAQDYKRTKSPAAKAKFIKARKVALALNKVEKRARAKHPGKLIRVATNKGKYAVQVRRVA